MRALHLRGEVFRGEDRRATDRRLEELSEGEWAGAAVKRSLDEVMVVATVVAVTAGTSSSS